VRQIQLACSHGPVRLFINNTGQWEDARGNWIHYGLCVGSSDLIGWRAPRAQFIALEVKTGRGRLSQAQENFGALVQQMGGVFAVCRSVEEAQKALSIP
jgi:hypothetical protein